MSLNFHFLGCFGRKVVRDDVIYERKGSIWFVSRVYYYLEQMLPAFVFFIWIFVGVFSGVCLFVICCDAFIVIPLMMNARYRKLSLGFK